MKQIQIIGHLGRDAKLISHNGDEFTGFTVAVSDNYTNTSGEKVERTDWFNVSTRQLNIGQYLLKGTKVFVQGELKVKIYKNQEGAHQIDMQIRAEKIRLLSPVNQNATSSAPQANSDPTGQGEEEGDDLPF